MLIYFRHDEIFRKNMHIYTYTTRRNSPKIYKYIHTIFSFCFCLITSAACFFILSCCFLSSGPVFVAEYDDNVINLLFTLLQWLLNNICCLVFVFRSSAILFYVYYNDDYYTYFISNARICNFPSPNTR